MDILIFDMDGVLLEAKGYHRALQDTVKRAGETPLFAQYRTHSGADQ